MGAKGGGKGGFGKGGAGADPTKSRGRRRTKAKAAPVPPAEDDDDDDTTRSAALTDVRRMGQKCPHTLTDVLPHVLEFARDQHGSRFLQSRLDDGADVEEKQKVFEAVRAEAASLANDPFGNFVIQKFFDVGTVEQRKLLVQNLFDKLLHLSQETHGCRVIQKAIQHVPRESQLHLAELLQNNVIPCIESMHG